MAIGLELTWVRPTERADKSTLSLSDIAKYVIEYGTVGTTLSSLDITDNTATAYTLSPLIEGTTYRVRISVVDTVGRVSQLSGFVYGVASELGELPLPDTSNLLTDSFNTLALTLDNETVDETGDGATLTIDSNSDAGTLYSYSKTTAFTGTDEENAAEIIANGVGQVPVVGENVRVVTGQDKLTDHYAGWVQDSDGYGADLAMEFNIATDAETLTIPAGAGTYLFDIDWGDGTVETGLTTQGAGPHTYTLAGDYVVRISGVFPHLYFNGVGDILKLIRILNYGDIGWLNCTGSFRGADNLIEETSETANFSEVLLMPAFMFSLLSGTPPLLRGFDMRKVIDVTNMLRRWAALGAVDIPIDQWQIPAMATATNFLYDSQLTTACYDRTLASWGNQTLAAGALSTTIHFGSSTYTDQASKDLLLAQCAGIIDGGVAP